MSLQAPQSLGSICDHTVRQSIGSLGNDLQGRIPNLDGVTSRFYDSVQRTPALELPRTRAAIRLVTTSYPKRILDVGAGDGAISAELRRVTGAELSCVDVSEQAVGICRERGLDAHCLEIDRTPLPFADHHFDVVFMTEVVEHLVNPDFALDEVHRVLTSKGRLILSTPNLACLPNRLLVPLGLQPLFTEVSSTKVLGRWLRSLGQGGEPVGHLRVYTKRALVEFLREHRFRVLRVSGTAFHPTGVASTLERAISSIPSLAMIVVVLAEAM
jgi:2-polyprenyl-3-methyl-5-hydroxy-6-metoxy-1,4-benzoquinol methylase